VIALLALLAAGLADTNDVARRQARLNEVTNRLGIRVEAPTRDLRSILVQQRLDLVGWVIDRTVDSGLVARIRDNRWIIHEIWADCVGTVRRIDRDTGSIEAFWRAMGTDPVTLRWFVKNRKPMDWPNVTDPAGVTIEGTNIVTNLNLPPTGYRNHELERYVPWIFREVRRSMMDVLIATRMKRPIPPPFDQPYYTEASSNSLFRVGAHVSERIVYVWSNLLDWLDATNADLYRYSWQDAITAQAAWHDSFKGKAGYREPTSRGVTWVRFGDGATIERLCTQALLEQEGASMAHCVGGYWPTVRDGGSVIYSYRDPKGVPQATLEISLYRPAPSDPDSPVGRLVQIQGPDDSEIRDQLAKDRMLYFVQSLRPLDRSTQIRKRLSLPEFDTDGWDPYEIESHFERARRRASARYTEEGATGHDHMIELLMEELTADGEPLFMINSENPAVGISLSPNADPRSELQVWLVGERRQDGHPVDPDWSDRQLGWIDLGLKYEMTSKGPDWTVRYRATTKLVGDYDDVGTFEKPSEALMNPVWFPKGEPWKIRDDRATAAGVEWALEATSATEPQSWLVEEGHVVVVGKRNAQHLLPGQVGR
jgi:hypothetical protein